MAIYNEILAARFARALQKLTSMKGGVPAKQLAGEIMPVFPMFWGAELRYLESWSRYGLDMGVAAAATFLSIAQLRNPTNSGVVAVLEKVLFVNTNGTAQQMNFGGPAPRQLDYGNTFPASTINRMDFRGQQVPTLVPTWTNSVAAVGLPTTSLGAVVLPANTGLYDFIITDIQEVPLLPGDSAQFYAATVNNTLSCKVWWRERALEDSEKT